MCAMTRTTAAGLVLEFVAVCFVLCSGWLQFPTKDKDRGNSGGAKTPVVGNFDILFFLYFRPDEGGCILVGTVPLSISPIA